MDFELTKEQKDIAKAARELAEGELTDRAEEFDREEAFNRDHGDRKDNHCQELVEVGRKPQPENMRRRR